MRENRVNIACHQTCAIFAYVEGSGHATRTLPIFMLQTLEFITRVVRLTSVLPRSRTGSFTTSSVLGISRSARFFQHLHALRAHRR